MRRKLLAGTFLMPFEYMKRKRKHKRIPVEANNKIVRAFVTRVHDIYLDDDLPKFRMK